MKTFNNFVAKRSDQKKAPRGALWNGARGAPGGGTCRISKDAENLQTDDDNERDAAQPKDDAFHEGLRVLVSHDLSGLPWAFAAG